MLGIVADGLDRVRSATWAAVRARVEAQFQDRLARAGVWERFLLRWERRTIIRDEVERLIPRKALYLRPRPLRIGLHRTGSS